MFDKKNNSWMIATFLLLGLIIGVGLSQGYGLISKALDKNQNAVIAQNNNQNQQQNSQNQQVKPNTNIVVDVSVDDDPIEGDKDAKVTIIEFSDFQCPYCARFFNGAYSQIKSQYIDTGKVKLVFRDFPLSFHQYAMQGAVAANCVREQDEEKYWDMHDLLFSKPADWLSSSDVNTALKTFASDLGVNAGKFETCLSSDKYTEEINKDIADGRTAGVRGTPTLFVNGRMLVGALPFDSFKTVIDEELAK
ncbi:MAG: DSBA oxidoreductase [Candidatus Peregrinibacteria bacterium GW2011_GWF2_33_10]|nr:MAG: DSBA oxidoreductase [Candidatus Peregrinibacteria bacterium GW2011_GWF2_33_10]OGJ44997.1 MAG: hypothetical protein A2263_02960 [Candidatus Peregrinibacteria bacterium RIFOXYA2_FULL_33_21]